MRLRNRIVLLAFLAGLLSWVADAALHSSILGESSFLDSLILDVPAHHIHVRVFMLLVFFVAGLVIGRLVHSQERRVRQIEHLNSVLAAIRDVNQLIVSETEEERLLPEACEILTRARDYDSAWLALVDDAGSVTSLHTSGLDERTRDSFREWLHSTESVPCIEQVEAGGKAVAMGVVDECCPACPVASAYRHNTAIVAPLELQGRRHGFLGVSVPASSVADEEERSLIEELAYDISLGLHTIRTDEELRRRSRELEERIKELRCLYGVSRLCEQRDSPLSEVIEEIAEILADSTQWPDVSTARIRLEDLVSEAGAGDGPEAAVLRAEIVVADEEIGEVQLRYHAERPERDEGPFLAEERAMIDLVSASIARMVAQRRAEAEVESLTRFPAENPSPVLRVRDDLTVDHANPPALQMLEELGGGLGLRLPQELRETVEQVIASNRASQVEVPCGQSTVLFTCSPVLEHGYVNLYGVDVTDRVRAQEALRLLNEQLEERVRSRTLELEAVNQELEAFAHSVSHDLRAPLRAMDGFSRIVLEDYGDRLDDRGREYLDRVSAASTRMGALIDDLLSLSRVARAQLNITEVDMSALAAEIVEELQQGQPDRNAEVLVQDRVFARGDPVLLRSLLQNMLQNAWKFTAREEVARIEFGLREINGEQTCYVRDNGVGFDMAYAEKAFGTFHRLHSAHEFPGTGIGLATVRRIVRRHHGRVWAEATEDEGATFYFTLKAE